MLWAVVCLNSDEMTVSPDLILFGDLNTHKLFSLNNLSLRNWILAHTESTFAHGNGNKPIKREDKV